jgi:hypothetical protein
MAVTGRRAFLLAAIACCAVAARADDSHDVHAVIDDLANALSAGELTQAMSVFSKKCPNYEKLSDYFDGLTSAYFVENTLDFTGENVSATEATVSLRWDLALTTKQGGDTANRSAELTLKLMREGKHWRIVELGPITLFDPSAP